MGGNMDALKMDFNARGGPGHPVKYIFHRSTFDFGPYYRNVADWQFEKAKSLYRKNLLAHFGCVNAIEFSKDGCLLVSGGDDRRVLLWNVDKAMVSKQEPRVLQAEHLSNVFSLDFSCSSSKIISAGNDDQVIVHDIKTGVPLDYFVHEQPVYGVSADPVNESIFCSACDDGRILIFDIRESGNDPFCLAKLTSAFHSVMFHPIEPRLVVTANSKEGVASWDVRMPKRVFVKYGMQNSNQCCMSARFNKMGSQILVLRRRLPPILYATDSPVHLYQFNHRGYYNSCTMKSCSFAGQNDQYVLSGSDNFDLHLWKIPISGSDQWVNKADMVLRGHRSIVNQVRYNYTHNVIASSGVEKIVKLWSPFPMPDEPGGKTPSVVTNESERRIYTPDDYVSLVMQAGQGHFMSLTYEAGRKTTREDSRMLAFFDALVQRDINGLSDEESDNFPETSYTNTIYTSPETSSSENEDEDSNPPNYRSLLSPELTQAAFSSLARSTTRNENLTQSVVEPATIPDQTTTNENSQQVDANARGGLGQADLQEPLAEHVEDGRGSDNESSQHSEDRNTTANMITQLILEKENSRRKLLPRSYVTAGRRNSGNHSVPAVESDSDESSSNEGSTNSKSSPTKHASLRSAKKHDGRQVKSNHSKSSTSKYSKKRKRFRKQLLRARKREMMSTPVYESSRNATETVPSTETSYDRISELMTRNQSTQSDSSLNSSCSSSSESSSSEENDVENSQKSVMKEGKKMFVTKKSHAVISSDSSSSESETTNDSEENPVESKPSSSNSNSISKDLKRKRRPPSCKLNEACKAFFKRYLDSESETHRTAEESVVPRKKPHLENLESPSTNSSTETTVEHVPFKKVNKAKERNYRKASTGLCTPPDSGIDVSKEPEPCCSKSFGNGSICTNTSSTAKTTFKNHKTNDESRPDHFDDPGFGQVDSDGESE